MSTHTLNATGDGCAYDCGEHHGCCVALMNCPVRQQLEAARNLEAIARKQSGFKANRGGL